MILGITGGIGSGKSTVCRIFKILGLPIYDSDSRARLLTDTNTDIRLQITKIFGPEAYLNDKLNRTLVADLVFKSPPLLQSLNAIVHPAVSSDFYNWVIENQHHPWLIKESAILFESNAHQTVDRILTVVSPMNLRIQRVIKRDHLTENDVLDRMKNQWNDEEKIKLSNFVVHCNDKVMIIDQVLDIYKCLLK